MENENKDFTEQEINELAKQYNETVDNLSKKYDAIKNTTSLADSFKGITEETASLIAAQFKAEREDKKL